MESKLLDRLDSFNLNLEQKKQLIELIKDVADINDVDAKLNDINTKINNITDKTSTADKDVFIFKVIANVDYDTHPGMKNVKITVFDIFTGEQRVYDSPNQIEATEISCVIDFTSSFVKHYFNNGFIIPILRIPGETDSQYCQFIGYTWSPLVGGYEVVFDIGGGSSTGITKLILILQ